MTGVAERVEAAGSVQELLDAALGAFEEMLAVIRCHDQPGGDYFVPMVMAAVPAAGGRDYLLWAPSLPPMARQGVPGGGDRPASAGEAAAWVSGLCRALADRLDGAALTFAVSGDRDACAGAAGCAREISALLGGP